MADFTLNMGNFSATEGELTANSEAGIARMEKALGTGAVSCKMPKSEAARVERELSGEGFAVDIWTEGPFRALCGGCHSDVCECGHP